MKKKKGLIARLMGHAGKLKITMLLSWLFSAISGVINIGTYICIYYVAQTLLQNNGTFHSGEAAKYGWMVFQLASASFGVYGLGLALSHITAFKIMANVRIQLIRHLGKTPLGYHAVNPSGKIRKIIEKNAENTENFVAHQMPDMAQSIVMPIAFLVSMFYFDWRMSLVCLIPIIIGFISLSTMLKTERGDFIKNYQAALGDMGNAGVEYVRGISVVKVFGQTVHSFKRFYKSIMEYQKFAVKYVLSMEKPMSIYITAVNGLFFFLVPAAIILYNFTDSPEKVLLSFVFFIVFMPLVSVILMRIMSASSNMMMATQALDAIEEILEVPVQKNTDTPKTPLGSDIVFDHVSFGYGDGASEAVSDLSFVAKAGSVTALVGPSGSGKSTVANLIARFWDTDTGIISVGGVNVQELDYDIWMKQLSFVFQDAGLLKMSIADNVAFCVEHATEEEILAALHTAQCDDILEKLPDGIHTVVGTKGIYLSGGEMQRIALARAILQDAPVVLLDEATAFADPENEYRIQKVLNVLLKGKTVIMIAHRLSTVTEADNIIVLREGYLTEQGSHRELLEKDGFYAKMYREYNTGTKWKFGGAVNAQKNIFAK